MTPVKRMKPLGFTLDEMRDLLQILDSLAVACGDKRAELQDRLAMFHTAAQARVQALREQLSTAEGFARQIQDHVDQHNR
ncbi:MerR family DNA-binding protein [Couchioplanes caeruleus]|uniref:MerR family DNA-binding protein n=1 Tax=Couchioplanes caeruleus TaxID=56438 RepID=UPI003D313D12